MSEYTAEELRRVFQLPFNRDTWKVILHNLFGATQLRTQSEPIPDCGESEKGYYMGAIDTSDAYRIGLFYYEITNASVAHKKVGLRNLVRKFINQSWGEFDAAIVVFNDKKEWRLSFVCDIKDVATAPRRFTFVFGEHDNFYRTPIERFTNLQRQERSFRNIREAFSVEALSDDFFNRYRELYADFVQYITGKRYVKQGSKWKEQKIADANDQLASTFDNDEKLVRDYIKKMFGRIVFLYFLQRKGWLNGNRNYMHDLFANSDKKDDFLDGVLEPLFFEVLNTDKPYRIKAAQALPGSDNIPYLNGGLFERDDVDPKLCKFPAEFFEKLFDFLDSYNFTIDENEADDAEVGIDPEMLGRIFENLLEDNKDKGAYYTPKEIVAYMCRESIIAYLETSLPEIAEEPVRKLVERYDVADLTKAEMLEIRKKLQAVKICDPAIGSGAFPMGLVNLLSKLYVAMKADTDTKKMKRHILEQNIYGVDIDRGAVDIARLRFWLAMIVEPTPLPNLRFKIMQGNSLLESYNGIDLSNLTKNNVNRTLFDSDDSERERLCASLKSYYKTTDHQERAKLFNEIINNVRRQLHDKQIDIPSDLDVSANDKFFLWHTWFSDVFANGGGFDIVIGNPPYVQTKDITPEAKELFKQELGFSDDLYNLFTFKGLNLCSSGASLTYITPKTFWTIQTKRNMRELMLSHNLRYVFDTANPFQSVMVDTCIWQVVNTPFDESKDYFVTFKDGSSNLFNPIVFSPLKQSVYRKTLNSVIFKPTKLNLCIWELYGERVKSLYDKWWDKIKTSRDIEKNKAELERYRASLKPGDIALLGCLTEGGQGLATANNGKYIAVRRSSKWAKNIISSRPKKLAEVIARYKPNIPDYSSDISVSEFLARKSENEIASLFDSLKEKYGRDIFGQGYLYKIIDDDELADVSALSDEEKENGIDTTKKFYVPYDKGDKDGNRWYLETPFAIAWSKENVRFLKTNSGKKGQGMPVVRNSQFFFKEGLCWSDINTTFLKCRKKQRSINDVKSMSIYSVTESVPEDFIITLINSTLLSYYVDTFINNTQTFQINDARQLPIIIPTLSAISESVKFVTTGISIKRDETSDISLESLQSEVDDFVMNIYNLHFLNAFRK